MADDRIEIEIVLDDGSVKKGLATVRREGDKTARNLTGSFKGLTTAILGLGTALAGVFAGKKILAAAARQEEAVKELNTSLKLAGSFSEEASRGFQEFAAEIQQTTRFGDEAILSQLALARNFARSNEEAQNLVKTAVDLSEATGISLDSAVRNLGKTFSGLTGELGEAVPQVRELTAEQLKAGEAITVLAERFGGAAQENVKTFSGALEQLGNNFGDVLESIGKIATESPAVIVAINEISKAFASIATAISESVAGQDIAKDIIINFSVIAQAGIETARRIGLSFELAFLRAEQAFLAFKVATTLGLSESFNKDLQRVNEQIEKTKAAFSDRTEIIKFFDELIQKVSATSQKVTETVKGTTDNIKESFITVGEGFDIFTEGFTSKLKDLVDSADKGFRQIGASAAQGLGKTAAGAFASFGKALAKGEDGLQAFLGAALQGFAQIAIQLGSQFILTGIAYKFSGLPNLQAQAGPLIAAGAALATFGGALSAIGTGGGGAGGGGGAAGGGVVAPGTTLATDTEEDAEIIPEDRTRVVVNVQGDVLDSRDTGLRIVDILNESFDTEGTVLVTA